jgi:serine acetyltransferase
VWRNLHDDVTRFLNKSPENQAIGDHLKSRIGATLTPQLLCLVIYRLSHWLHLTGRHGLARRAQRLNVLLHHVHLSADSCIGPGCLLPHPAGVFFVGRAGEGLTVYSMAVCTPDSATPLAGAGQGPWLGARVTLGVHAVLLGNLHVGDDTKIGFCVRADSDLPGQRIVMPRHWRPGPRRPVATARPDGVAP